MPLYFAFRERPMQHQVVIRHNGWVSGIEELVGVKQATSKLWGNIFHILPDRGVLVGLGMVAHVGCASVLVWV